MSQPIQYSWNVLIAAVFLIFLTPACTPTLHHVPDTDDELVGRIQPAPTVTEEIRRGALWYQLVLHQDHISVRLRLLNPSPRTSFFLPGPWAGHNDFAEDITLAGARGPDGPLPITIDRNQGRIDVDTHNASWVEVDYSVQLHTQSAHQPGEQIRYRGQLREEVLLAYAPTFLILPSDAISRTLRDIAIELRVPTHWEVITTWPLVHLGPSGIDPRIQIHGFIVDDVRSLRDAFIAAGPTIDAHHHQIDAHKITIAFEPGFGPVRQEIVTAIHTIVHAYMNRYGARSDVTVFVTTAPEQTHEALRGMGRRAGFVLELPAAQTTPRIDEQTLILIAHEALHMWNGHELVPDPTHEPQTRWFKEGLTHYIALQTLRRLGLIEEKTLLDELAKSAALYTRNPARQAQNPPSRFDTARFPYDQGMMLALAIDTILHESTPPHFTLDDWLIDLLENARNAAFYQYTEDDLKRTLLAGAGPAAGRLNTLWNRSLHQQIPIPVAELFQSIGLHWLDADPRLSPRLLPLEGLPPTYLQIFSGP